MGRSRRVSKTPSHGAAATLTRTALRIVQRSVAVAPLILGVSSIAASGCTSILGDYQLIDTPAPPSDTDASSEADASSDVSASSDAGIDDGSPADIADAGCMSGDSGCCNPGTITCQGNVATTCDLAGHPLPNPESCPGMCVPGKGCQACQLGLKKCEGQSIRNCVVASDGGVDAGDSRADGGVLYGTWSEAVPCTYVCTPAGNSASCTGDCKPGIDTKRCNGARQVQSCVNGKWVDGTLCTNAVCTGLGECTPTCKVGSTQCNDKTVQTCNEAGSWVDAPAKCQYVCTGGACTGSCTPGTTMCVGTKALQTCETNGEFGSLIACPAVCQHVGSTDAGSTDTCGGDCSPGARRCNGTKGEYCVDSAVWTTVFDCSVGGKVCDVNPDAGAGAGAYGCK